VVAIGRSRGAIAPPPVREQPAEADPNSTTSRVVARELGV
jgi:hypothetical protein